MKFLLLIIILSVSTAIDAKIQCEEIMIRGPISGFGLGTKLHPDYVTAYKHNQQQPNLGVAGIKVCNGKEKIAIYRIYQTGAISLIYRDINHPYVTVEKTNCDTLMKPFRNICKIANDFTDIITKMNKQQINNSYKYVLLNKLKDQNSCQNLKSKIMREITRLDSLPWLKETAFGMKFKQLISKSDCKLILQKKYTNPKEKFTRLVVKGEQVAFATLEFNKHHELIAFDPLTSFENIGNLPLSDSCIKLARSVANIPNGNAEARKRLYEKLDRLRSFDNGPKIPAYIKPIFANNKDSFVKQGTGKNSDKPLYTDGLYTCIGIAVINKSTSKAFLIHADALTNISQIFDEHIIQLGSGKLEAIIAGGLFTDASRDTCYRALQSLDKHNVKILGYRVNLGLDSIAVDPQKGKFY